MWPPEAGGRGADDAHRTAEALEELEATRGRAEGELEVLEGRIKELQILAESTEKLRARLEEIASEKLDALLAEKCHRVYRELVMMVKVDKDGEVAAESPVSSFCKSRNAC